MKNYTNIFLSAIVIVSLFSCQADKKDLTSINKLNDSIKKQYAPDKRVAIYDISISTIQNSILLKGESDQANAVKELKQKLIDTG
ncbi:MAG: hypothetical protein KAH72_00175, partial [Flavobacteriaceae bacterium]|nr:hypothetical protein [Flavobacteriaceae bacterium]